jgi:hypothetical protein
MLGVYYLQIEIKPTKLNIRVTKMSINEVFVRPTVKEVIFQIKFPNLFLSTLKLVTCKLK